MPAGVTPTLFVAAFAVCWDYHVVLASKSCDDAVGWRVWDLDSVAPFPCPAARYLSLAFPRKFRVPVKYQP